MQTIYLSKRNLLVLLSKLERVEQGDQSACSIIKHKNTTDPFCNTMDSVIVVAVPDEQFYVNRAAGAMHPLDEEKIKNA